MVSIRKKTFHCIKILNPQFTNFPYAAHRNNRYKKHPTLPKWWGGYSFLSWTFLQQKQEEWRRNWSKKKKAAMNSLLGMLSSDKRFSRYIWCSVFIISSTFVMISFRTLQSDRNHDESKRETPQLLKFISSFEQKETFFPSVTIYSCTFSWTCQ